MRVSDPRTDAELDLAERAAIREYLGGFSREEAERLASEDVERMAAKERSSRGR